jgi:twitching motility protein PilT
MEQNTAPNNSTQFSYPDFSTTASQQQGQANNQAQTPVTGNSTKKDVHDQVNEAFANEVPMEKPYTQEPTPLPGINKEIPSGQIADVAPTPVGEGFDPLPSDLPKFKETLEKIIPDSQPQEGVEEGFSEFSETDDVQDGVKPVKKEITSETNPSSGGLTIHNLLSEAVNRNASDLHLAVGYPPILRIDGDLINLDENLLSPADTEALIFSVLNDEKKELLEVNREIDFAYTYEGAMNARFRINAYYSMKNLSAAFRLIPSRVKTVEELMLPQLYNQFAKLKQGLILVTGPTGHGKSTTIAAILEAINRTRFCHIVTIEDPIEYVFEGKKALIDQREMNDDTHSWNIALRSALRQDPDVILVGEMRDFETIASAITLAETGHLVFATLHTNSASQTLDRIIDVFPENQQQQVRTQMATTLEAVVAQRLIPLDQGGRRAVSEIMLNNSAVSNMIREGKTHQIDNVIRTSSDIGMIYLERSLVNLVREGVISVQKAQDFAVHPEEVLRLLKN